MCGRFMHTTFKEEGNSVTGLLTDCGKETLHGKRILLLNGLPPVVLQPTVCFCPQILFIIVEKDSLYFGTKKN